MLSKVCKKTPKSGYALMGCTGDTRSFARKCLLLLEAKNCICFGVVSICSEEGLNASWSWAKETALWQHTQPGAAGDHMHSSPPIHIMVGKSKTLIHHSVWRTVDCSRLSTCCRCEGHSKWSDPTVPGVGIVHYLITCLESWISIFALNWIG